MGHFLCLEYWETDETLKEIPLADVEIWVQVHGLEPMDLPDDESMERSIGDHIGEYIEADSRNRRHIMKYGFIRLQVRLNCYEVIKSGMWIYQGGRRKYWVDFKYEKLAEMCYNCGHLGHSTGLCEVKLDLPHPQFGPWLRTEPIRFKEDEYFKEDCKEITTKLLLFLLCSAISVLFTWKLLRILEPKSPATN